MGKFSQNLHLHLVPLLLNVNFGKIFKFCLKYYNFGKIFFKFVTKIIKIQFTNYSFFLHFYRGSSSQQPRRGSGFQEILFGIFYFGDIAVEIEMIRQICVLRQIWKASTPEFLTKLKFLTNLKFLTKFNYNLFLKIVNFCNILIEITKFDDKITKNGILNPKNINFES